MKALEYLLSRPLLATPESVAAAERIVRREESGEPWAVRARAGRKVDGTKGVERRGSVALIDCVGPIFRYSDWFVDLCGGATVEAMATDLTSAIDDPTVSAVVIHFDTPGGEAAGVAELADMIRAGTGRKPVVAYVSNQCCSGGYWLASACSEIVCAAPALIGCIGVVSGYTERAPKAGETRYKWVSSQSPLKHADPSTEAGYAEQQKVVDDMAAVFVAAVAANRDVSEETVLSEFGKGGVLIGRHAVDAGMADRLGSLEAVIADLNQGRRVGPAAPSASASLSVKEGPMNWTPKALKAWFAAGQPDTFEHPEATMTEPAPNPPPAPAPQPQSNANAAAESARELAEARKQIALAKAETIQARAEGWYDKLFAANLIVPAERDSALAAFVQASADDLTYPLGNGQTRLGAIEGIYKARTPHTLGHEQLSGGGHPPTNPGNLPPGYKTLVQTGGPEKPPSTQRVKELAQHLVNAGMANQAQVDAIGRN